MHVNQCNLRQAVVWLHERFGEAGAERAAIAFTRQVAALIIQLEPKWHLTRMMLAMQLHELPRNYCHSPSGSSARLTIGISS
jgi:hypothetical protein